MSRYAHADPVSPFTPDDTILRHEIRSLLVYIMACNLTEPGNCLRSILTHHRRGSASFLLKGQVHVDNQNCHHRIIFEIHIFEITVLLISLMLHRWHWYRFGVTTVFHKSIEMFQLPESLWGVLPSASPGKQPLSHSSLNWCLSHPATTTLARQHP